MRKILIGLVIIISFLAGFFIRHFLPSSIKNEDVMSLPKPKPLEKYTIENLSKENIKQGRFKILESIKEEESFTSYLFEFEFNPDLSGKQLKKTTGQINFPKSTETQFPIVVMFRGYVDQELYKTGDGTKNAAKYFAENGFITIASDFLGYGESDEEAGNIFESRFQTYVTVLSLIKSLDQVPSWDKENLFLLGHSNGGQIALTILEVTSATYPTVLWAPVSKPFPYSILYYTDESEDRGKLIRKELAKFENDYDVEKYSLANYFDRINSPLQIHQGTNDDAVPVDWTDSLVKYLKTLNKDVTYYTYPGADHNLRPDWNTAVSRDLEFFRKFDKNQLILEN